MKQSAMKISSSRFIDGLVEQSRGKSAWFYAFWAMLCINIYQGERVISSLQDNKQILIPYTVAVGNKEIDYSGDYTSGTGYIAHLARADVMLWGNWTPRNAEKIMAKFSNRLHPKIYSKFHEESISTAKVNSSREVTQRASIIGDLQHYKGKIKASVLIQKYVAGEPFSREMRDIIIGYKTSADNSPMIISFENIAGKS